MGENHRTYLYEISCRHQPIGDTSHISFFVGIKLQEIPIPSFIL